MGLKTYKIEVREILARTLSIKANSEDHAISIVKKLYEKEKIVLDYSDFQHVGIWNKKRLSKSHLMKEIISYLYDIEEKHYEESEKPNDHIFLKLKTLNQML